MTKAEILTSVDSNRFDSLNPAGHILTFALVQSGADS